MRSGMSAFVFEFVRNFHSGFDLLVEHEANLSYLFIMAIHFISGSVPLKLVLASRGSSNSIDPDFDFIKALREKVSSPEDWTALFRDKSPKDQKKLGRQMEVLAVDLQDPTLAFDIARALLKDGITLSIRTVRRVCEAVVDDIYADNYLNLQAKAFLRAIDTKTAFANLSLPSR